MEMIVKFILITIFTFYATFLIWLLPFLIWPFIKALMYFNPDIWIILYVIAVFIIASIILIIIPGRKENGENDDEHTV